MTSVIVDSRISTACSARLRALGFNVIELPPCSALPTPISAHPDTLICQIGGELICSADYCDTAPYVFSDIREMHPDACIRFCSEGLADKYPGDCAYNALAFSGRLFARVKSIAQGVLDAARCAGLQICEVNQGYAACTTLAFVGRDGEPYAVTSDAGMAEILKKCNVKVTKISNSGISLPPYEYGFIGGASGVYGDKVYFLGDIRRHPDADAILCAIEEAGLFACSLSDEELCDMGGLIFIE